MFEERVIRIILVVFAGVIHICARTDGPNVGGRNGADSRQRVIRTGIIPALRSRTRHRAPTRTVPMQHQRISSIVACPDGPHVIGCQGRYSGKPIPVRPVRTGHDAPFGAVPVHGECVIVRR